MIVELKSISPGKVNLLPGEVRLEVYKAAKLRKLHTDVELKLMSYQDEIDYAKRMKLGTFIRNGEIPGKVTHVS
jgi:hypothetical protein